MNEGVTKRMTRYSYLSSATFNPLTFMRSFLQHSRLSDKDVENDDVNGDGDRAPALEKVVVDLSKFRPFFRCVVIINIYVSRVESVVKLLLWLLWLLWMLWLQ